MDAERLYPDLLRIYDSGQLAVTETMMEEHGTKYKVGMRKGLHCLICRSRSPHV